MTGGDHNHLPHTEKIAKILRRNKMATTAATAPDKYPKKITPTRNARNAIINFEMVNYVVNEVDDSDDEEAYEGEC